MSREGRRGASEAGGGSAQPWGILALGSEAARLPLRSRPGPPALPDATRILAGVRDPPTLPVLSASGGWAAGRRAGGGQGSHPPAVCGPQRESRRVRGGVWGPPDTPQNRPAASRGGGGAGFLVGACTGKANGNLHATGPPPLAPRHPGEGRRAG